MSQTISNANVISHVGQLLSAKKYYAALQQLSTISLSCSKDLVYLTYLSHTQEAIKDFAGLIKTQQEIVRLRGSVSDRMELMKSLYLSNKKNESLDVGLQLQMQALSAHQEYDLARLLVKIYLEENDFEGVAEVISKSQFSEEDDFLLWAQGVVFLNNDQKDQALEYFRRAVQLNVKNDQAWVSLGLMHKNMGDDDLFLANIERAMDLNPYNVSALKLYSQSTIKNKEKTLLAFERIQFYLSEYCFDEDISVCHAQMLCQIKKWDLAQLELDKLIFNQPGKEELRNMKKSMGEAQVLC